MTYACKATYCYGVDAQTDGDIRALQGIINYYAKVCGFSAMTPDGKIGSGTVNALALIAKYFQGSPSLATAGGTIGTIGATKEMAAASIPSLIPLLHTAAVALNLTTASPPIIKTPTQPTPQVPSTPPVPGAGIPLPPGAKKPIPWTWIIGGGVIAAALIGGYFLMNSSPVGE